ncbi:MAG: hypothetical protein GY842_03610 [bacterium]|nr:hypothetical protein [bacterium]
MVHRWSAMRGGPLLALVLAVAVGGCAQPQGELFPPIEPAVVWPASPETPRIRLVGELAGSGDLHAAVSGGEVLLEAFHGPRPPLQFANPHAVALAKDRWVAVADSAAAVVHIIDLVERNHTVVGGWGESERLGTPVGVAWVGERLFVTDAKRHEVIELSTSGAHLGSFGGEALTRPVGIAYVASSDRLYVVDGGAHALVVFDLTGAVVARLGHNGVGPGEFNYPTHIAWDGGEHLLVADAGNFRVQLLGLDGTCVRSIGQKGDGAGDFSLPKGVAFDRDGHLYVIDSHFENVQIFDRQGRLLLAFGEEGAGRGQFALPAGLAIDHHNRIWVADSANHRLQVFAYMRNRG